MVRRHYSTPLKASLELNYAEMIRAREINDVMDVRNREISDIGQLCT